MKNSYFDDEDWLRLRDCLAAVRLRREISAMIMGAPVEDETLVEAAREAASQQMGEIGLMPKSLREQEPA